MEIYEKYKHSGIDWIGEIPEHWGISQLGYISTIKARLGWKGLTAKEYVDDGYIFLATPNIKNEGYIDFENVNYITGERYFESPEIMLEEGDVLLVKDGSTLGIVNIVRELPSPSTVNSSIAVIRTTSNFNSEFIFRWLSSDYIQSKISLMKAGQGVPHLFQADIKKFIIFLPLLEEQKTIARYLDCKTAEIDSLIAQKQRLIELYEEEKTAIINQAVTKGINLDVKLKPSGIDWLGDIPEHWEVKRLKFACQLETGHTPSRSTKGYWITEECTIPWVSLNDTKTLANNDYISETAYKISQKGIENSSAHLIDEGAVVFTRDATIGLAAITTKKMAVSQHIIAWVCPPEIHNFYLLHVIYSMREELESRTMGSTLKTIGMSDLKQLTIPIPPLSEQIEISNYIQSQRLVSDAKITKTQRIIELQKEYRTALISEAVTGKIKVPELAT